jgi:enamine deaminase RidA (YjgF/YER057c/UK114 family)
VTNAVLEVPDVHHPQVAQDQAVLDDHVKQLVSEMDNSCEMAKHAVSLRKRAPRFDEIFIKIMQQVTECAYFVSNYYRDTSFGTCSRYLSRHSALYPAHLSGVRAAKHLISGAADQVTIYIANLQTLCNTLHGESSVSCLVTVCRVLDDVKKTNLALENLRM